MCARVCVCVCVCVFVCITHTHTHTHTYTHTHTHTHTHCTEYSNLYINSSSCSRNIHSILYTAADIGIVIFRQSSHSDVPLTPTLFSFQPAAHFDGFFILTCCSLQQASCSIHPYLVSSFFDLSFLHPFSFLNVLMSLQ